MGKGYGAVIFFSCFRTSVIYPQQKKKNEDGKGKMHQLFKAMPAVVRYRSPALTNGPVEDRAIFLLQKTLI
jgi:hypothetical protein